MASPIDKDQKNIPLELTAYGTTPSGKPRLFVCQVCTRAFARLEHLRRHERSHTKEKPFACGVCQRKFSRRDLLLRHAQKLHAGCSDAITRLRRKSIKRGNLDDDEYASDEMEMSYSPSASSTPLNIDFADPFRKKMKLPPSSSQPSSPLPSSPTSATPMRKDSSLSRQLFKGRRRGTSFSAQSGQSYAQAQPPINDSVPSSEGVEFSTPQLLPQADDLGWLSNLSTIPGILNPNEASDSRRLSIASTNSFSLNGDNFNMGSAYSMPTSTMGSEVGKAKREDVDFGYSFYDIPEQMFSAKAFDSITKNMTPESLTYHKPLSPIQDGETPTAATSTQGQHQRKASQVSQNGGIDFSTHLADIDGLTQEFDVNSKFMPGGYTFYGDNPSVSSSGIEVQSPSILDGNMFGESWRRASAAVDQRTSNGGGFSTQTLFTSNIRSLIAKALAKYPISGIMTPTIPSNEKLELYLTTFKQVFLAHFPFIHTSKLNEAAVMAMTRNEDTKNESARACLPLLVATMGALLANNKSDSEHLYEASRRAIHIFLESRKQCDDKKKANPLWLIQSLTLSVIYGLFSDNENNVYIVIRQLNALNSLVKTSIKSGSPTLFGVDDEPPMAGASDASKWRHNIVRQSQTRIVFMIYRLTNFLLMMYNVPLTLSINDLSNICLPSRSEEALWQCGSAAEFDQRYPGQLQTFLDQKPPGFKETLVSLLRDRTHIQNLERVAKYGFVCLAHGIYEVRQYQEMKDFDVSGVFDFLTQQAPSGNNGSPVSADHEKLDYAMLSCFIRICSLVEFKMVKEQSWLRNSDELSKNYNQFLIDVLGTQGPSKVDGYQFVKIADNCMAILRMILFKSYDTDEANGSSAFSTDFGFLSASSLTSSSGDPAVLGTIESALHLRVSDEFESTPNSIHSQMLFHVFVLLATYSIYVAKKNSSSMGAPEVLFELNHRYSQVLKMLDKIEAGLSQKYPNKLDSEFNNLYMYRNNQGSPQGAPSGGIEKALYILKIGELVLNYLYETTIKVSIFRKLSASLLHIRKFLIDNESRILT
ncbi:hypothetical protein DIURU_003466 [Diutina rugosa]|uniref:C2H2-type domain-containing protein n=1 Tax=Diutina rugosa TaxID=5481 RepID=A0A642UN18_DIURU|nr:uncharacterized protein DIURU_003466 [Diutina rugosa]KAA8901096.1 hypothetical protein DIURU_003466 [Diutina rugosa]